MIKSFILVAVVSLGGYLVHRAELDSKRIRMNERRLRHFKKSLDENDRMFMEKALEMRSVGVPAGHNHSAGSVVVMNGTIVGKGSDRTDFLNDPSAHAEMEAIRDACKSIASLSLKGSRLYTSTRPCSMCLSLIYLTGIEKVFYVSPTGHADSVNFATEILPVYENLAKPQLERSIPEIRVPMPRSKSTALKTATF